MTSSVSVPPAACRNCGKVNDRLGEIRGEETSPTPGDLAMCIGCGHLTAYAGNGQLRALTAAELMEAMQDPAVQRALMVQRHWK